MFILRDQLPLTGCFVAITNPAILHPLLICTHDTATVVNKEQVQELEANIL